ncbi:MAG TPA: hypothetical protein DDX06_12915 [Curvibacter sp.]|nr:hypothetical protein [Curvibacter sp.]
MWASIRRWLKLAVLLGVVMVPTVHWLVGRSDAFASAEDFLRASPEVIRILGPISDLSLSWRGVSLREGGDSGSAEFTVNLKGQKTAGRAYVELRKRGVWEVQFVRLFPESGAPTVLLEKHESNRCKRPC